MTAAALLRELVPPAIVRGLRRVRPPRHGFFGDHGSFEQAARSAGGSGYVEPALVNALVRQQRTVADGAATGMVDSRLLQLAYALARAGADSADSLRVLDFGGALGFHEAQARRLFPGRRFQWHVVETDAPAAAGREHFARPGLEFLDRLEQASGRYDLVHASGSLQYVPDAEGVWARLISLDHRLLCVNRLPLVPGEADRFAVQRALAPEGMVATYPARFFGEEAWRRRVSGHRILAEWDVEGDRPFVQRLPTPRYVGMLLAPRDS